MPISMRMASGAIVCGLALVGCDGVFGLAHIPDRTDAAMPGDAPDAGPCETTPFGMYTDYDTGIGPFGIAVGLIDNDDDLDIVTANAGDGTITVLLGNGDGTFAPRIESGATAGANGVTLAFLDDDNNLDVAVASPSSNGLGILYGTGDGSFKTVVTYMSAQATDVVAVHYDNDNQLDLAVAGAGNITVWHNDGATFSLGMTVPVGSGVASIATADLDLNGFPDLVTANAMASTMSLSFHGGGTFGMAITVMVPMTPQVAVTGKILGGDERWDLVVVSSGVGGVAVFRNAGGMSFLPEVTIPLPGSPKGLALGDLDGNGTHDLAVSNTGQDKVTLLFNDGLGQFPTSATLQAGDGPERLVLADFDKDGRNDLAVVNRNNSNVRVFRSCPP